MRYRKVSNLYRMLIRLFLLLCTIVLFTLENLSIKEISVYSTIVCGVIIVLAYYEKKKIMTEYILIILFLILFHFGQSITYVLEPTRYLPIIDDFNLKYTIKALLYALNCIQIFDITYMMCIPGSSQKLKYRPCSKNYLAAADTVSKMGVALLAPIVLSTLAVKTIYSLKNGYMNLYAYDSGGYKESAVMPYLDNLFVILCVLRICSLSYNLQKVKTTIALMIVYSTMMFVSGSRSGMLSVLLTTILIYITKIKRERSEHKVKIFVIGAALVLSSVFMSYFRLITNKNSVGFEESIKYVMESNPITTMMIEMGGTLKPLIYCIEIFSSGEPLKLGTSYVASVCLLIPNIAHILGAIHPAAKLSNLSKWLMEYKQLSHGPGFSIVAESYYNFGAAGAFVFIFWALFFCRVLGEPEKQNEEQSFISYSTMMLVFSLIRGSTSDFIRFFVFEVIFLNIVVKLYAGMISKYNK